MDTLTSLMAEKQRLEVLESVIDAGMQTFVHVGNALLEIRDARLYRQEFGTFEDYCRERWGMSRIHAHRMIEAAAVTNNLLPIGNIPEHRIPSPSPDHPRTCSTAGSVAACSRDGTQRQGDGGTRADGCQRVPKAGTIAGTGTSIRLGR